MRHIIKNFLQIKYRRVPKKKNYALSKPKNKSLLLKFPDTV